ncbi:MAG TPA: DUF1934 domain-containing protein [Pantanalinema sp.]
MKHPVSIRVESRQLDAEGTEARLENRYEGTWYQQDSSDYVVYQDEGVQTTLRWDADEWRLFRRGADLEGFQLFRLEQPTETELRIQTSTLPLKTVTHRMQVTPLPRGRELSLDYTLTSGPDLIGNFTLIIQLTTHEVDETHG